ncbi:MAG TPA: hypothetical protein VHQ47_02965 [Phycisphaerae bacterium]|nr:hypothetical protein [Phycisphaerae bacterium]
MDRTVKLHLSSDMGVPTATIPCRWLWDLVEYLSLRRTNVRYSYGPEHFHVSFLSLDLPAVRQLLAEWSAGLAESASYEAQIAAP